MKKLQITAILFLCLFNVYAQFDGPGYYRIKSELSPNLYIAYENPIDGLNNLNQNSLELSADENGQSVIYIDLVPGSATEYNLFRRNSENYINAAGSVTSSDYDAALLTEDKAKFTIAEVGDSGLFTIGFYNSDDDRYIISRTDATPALHSWGSAGGSATRSAEWTFTKLDESFPGAGKYSFENVAFPGNYITFTTGKDMVPAAFDDTYSSVDIQTNNTGGYNLFRDDNIRFLYIKGATPQAQTEDANSDPARSIDDDLSRYEIIYDAPYWRIKSISGRYVGMKSDATKINSATGINTDNNLFNTWVLSPIGSASVENFMNPQEAFVAYPNPSSDGIFTLNKPSEWSVSSITGQFIKKGNGTQIDLKGQPAGVYVLISDTGKNATKLIIE